MLIKYFVLHLRLKLHKGNYSKIIGYNECLQFTEIIHEDI